MFLYQGKKINVDAPLQFDGVQYPAGFFRSAEAREQLGIVETPDPILPDSRFFYWSENADGSLTIVQKPIEQVVETIKQKIAADRYAVEVAGVSLPNGEVIATDRESQSKIAGALLYVQRNPSATINWKTESGWVTLTKADIENFADLIAAHVQACFDAEKAQVEHLQSLKTFEEIVALA